MEIQTICKNLGESGCLAFCDLFLIGIDEIELIKNFNRLVSRGILGKDCYVIDHNALINFFGCHGNYAKSDKIPKDKYYIANYEYMGKNHFVVELNGTIIYNSLDYSKCVSFGKKSKEVRFIS